MGFRKFTGSSSLALLAVMVEQADDHDGVHLMIHLAVDRDVRPRLAVAFAQVAGQFDPCRKGLRTEVLLNHFNVAVVAAREARAAHANHDGIERFRRHSGDIPYSSLLRCYLFRDQTRSPNPEGRKKAETRRPNSPCHGRGPLNAPAAPGQDGLRVAGRHDKRPAVFRISGFGLLSAFGSRPSDFAARAWLL